MHPPDQRRALSREFIELRAATPRREGPDPDVRPEDQLRRYIAAIDTASLSVLGLRTPGVAVREASATRAADLADWDLALSIAEALLRHGLGQPPAGR